MAFYQESLNFYDPNLYQILLCNYLANCAVFATLVPVIHENITFDSSSNIVGLVFF